MMSEVQHLYRLQQIDTEAWQKRSRLGEVLKSLKEDAHLLAARERASKVAAELLAWEARHKELSLEDESLKCKVKRSEERLYSGLVKNPKELTDLQNEIASLGRRRTSLEDDLLEAMIAIEEYEAEHDAAGKQLSAAESEWQRLQAHLKQEQNELGLRLQVLARLRTDQLPLISTSALRLYEAIGSRHGGLAVVHLRGNMCQGCQLNVSASIMKEADEGRLIQCDVCDRILAREW
jgi:hypothetical protein